MPGDAPFDVWDGEGIAIQARAGDRAAEEVAMHLDPELSGHATPPWSDLIDEHRDEHGDASPVSYFDDEQPELGDPAESALDDVEPDLEQLLERQHYAFKPA